MAQRLQVSPRPPVPPGGKESPEGTPSAPGIVGHSLGAPQLQSGPMRIAVQSVGLAPWESDRGGEAGKGWPQPAVGYWLTSSYLQSQVVVPTALSTCRTTLVEQHDGALSGSLLSVAPGCYSVLR